MKSIDHYPICICKFTFVFLIYFFENFIQCTFLLATLHSLLCRRHILTVQMFKMNLTFKRFL